MLQRTSGSRHMIDLALWLMRHSPLAAVRWRVARYLEQRIGHRIATARTSDGFLMTLDTSDFIQRTIFIDGYWERSVGSQINRLIRKGGLFVDVGANVGYFSLLAARLGAQVIAFEPNAQCANMIERNAALNGMTIDVRRICVSDQVGTAKMYIQDVHNPGAGSLKATGGTAFDVITDTLDNQIENAIPTLMKIDAEGAEYLIMMGAKKILSQHSAPPIICEISEFSLLQLGSSKDELFKLMASYGYKPTVISSVGRSNASKYSVYFQYDVLFEKG